MNIQILSDLHIEFEHFDISQTGADVVVLAGDIHVGEKGILWALESIPDRPIIYVMGNHEYYGNAYPKILNKLKEKTRNTNIHLLENDLIEINNVSFLGCTLWTDFNLFGSPSLAEYQASQKMMDFKKIRKSPSYSKIKPSDIAVIHKKSVYWLRESFDQIKTEKLVVVTHHAPSSRSVLQQYENDPLSASFASHLDDLVSASKAVLWIHGHMHSSSDYYIDDTRVICNPRGYPDERNPSFDPELVVQI